MQPVTYCRSGHDLLQCGKSEGLSVLSGELHTVPQFPRGLYCSSIYDSGTNGTEWNRLRLDLSCKAPPKLLVWVGDLPPPDMTTCSELWDWFEQNAVLTANGSDILLHGCYGRYFQFCVGTLSRTEEFCLRGFEASFPKQVFTEYLPRIYHGNPTLERFMGILQAVYLDTSAQIEGFSRQLDPALADNDALHELARWVGAEGWIAGLPRETGEQLVREAMWLHSHRGTRAALSRFLELITGSKPIIVEPFEWARMPKNVTEQLIYSDLYGKSCGLAVILLEKPPIEREKLTKLLEDFLPAGVECRPVFLQERPTVGDHSYLGVNTRLSTREQPVLGSGLLRLGMVRLAEEPAEEE